MVSGRSLIGCSGGRIGVVLFDVEQLHRTDADVGDGLAGWWVDLPGISYRGKVVAPAEWDAERVRVALEAAGQRLTYNVLCGLMYSRTRIDELERKR
jgi:hypothetical protein